MLRTYGADGVIEKTGPALGIAFSDALLHGWDVARATAQDATMPAGLPESAYAIVYGRFTPEQRPGVFKPEIAVPRRRVAAGEVARVHRSLAVDLTARARAKFLAVFSSPRRRFVDSSFTRWKPSRTMR